ncbi:nucleoid-associated protein [Dolichospermum sp. ST_sed3]|nr:nucleoid-associated protein [Dolichospermum sp. ST_sed3]
MSDNYVVEKAALHFIDRTKKSAVLAPHEIDLAAYQNQAEYSIIDQFFSRHLDHICNAEENLRTRPAVFEGPAVVNAYYAEIAVNVNCFYQRSCDLAQRLHDLSKKKRTSPGVLLVLWFRKTGIGTPFLALFKMDPGPSNTISLNQNNSGDLLLDLAIHHFEHSLPDESSRVLKWAITPHPNRSNYNVKVRDEQGGTDTSQYFMEFLGCTARLSENDQARVLLNILPEYAQTTHPGQDCSEEVHSILQELEAVPTITPTNIFETVQRMKVLPNFQLDTFQAELGKQKSEDLNISSLVLKSAKLQYSLPSGIVIKGPRATMEDLVEVINLDDGGKELRIR